MEECDSKIWHQILTELALNLVLPQLKFFLESKHAALRHVLNQFQECHKQGKYSVWR